MTACAQEVNETKQRISSLLLVASLSKTGAPEVSEVQDLSSHSETCTQNYWVGMEHKFLGLRGSVLKLKLLFLAPYKL